MNLLSLFKPAKKPDLARRRDSQAAVDHRRSVRKEVVKLSLRDTLARARVPAEWVGMEILPVVQSRSNQVHVRLVLRQWDDRLVQSIADVERAFVRRMKLLDATSTEWVRDITWRLALPDDRKQVQEVAAAIASKASSAPLQSAKSPDKDTWEGLLDPARDLQYRSDDGHPDFSPTQPML